MKAALRDKRRQEAVERRKKLLAGAPDSLVTTAERAQLYDRIWAMLKNIPRMSRRAKEAKADEIVGAQVAQLEAQRVEERKLVKPATESGLLVSGQRLIMTPDEARQMAAGR